MKKSIQIFLFLFLSSTVFCQDPTYNEEFQVNTYSSHNQDHQSISNLKNGGFVITWVSYNGTESQITAQIFDDRGKKVGDEFKVNSYTNDIISNPKVKLLKNGSFVIVWDGNTNSKRNVYAQLFTEDGLVRGNQFQINTDSIYYKYRPSIGVLKNGGFVVAYEGKESFTSQTFEIFAKVFDENGISTGNEIKVNTYSEDDQYRPTVSGLFNGGFVVCWDGYNPLDNNRRGVFAQIFNEYGIMVGQEFLVNSYTDYSQFLPSVIGLQENGFVVCWTSEYQDGNSDGIFFQMFENNGQKIGTERQANTNISGVQIYSAIDIFFGNRFIVTWENWNQEGNGIEIHSQIFSDNGSKVGYEFKVNDAKTYHRHLPNVASFSNNKFAVCWNSWDQDGWGYGVFAKYYISDPIDHILTSFNLLAPQTSSTINHNNPSFSWEQASNIHINFPWELTYDLYIDENVNFTNSKIFADIQDTTILPDTLTNGQTYYWKVLARTYSGDSLWSSDVFSFTVDPSAVTGIKENKSKAPENFVLHQNYPNPFNPSTKIKFTIPANVGNEDFRSLLKVYDILGNEIATLVNEQRPPGTYEVEFSADDFSLTSGIYFYKLSVGQFSETRKMLLIK